MVRYDKPLSGDNTGKDKKSDASSVERPACQSLDASLPSFSPECLRWNVEKAVSCPPFEVQSPANGKLNAPSSDMLCPIEEHRERRVATTCMTRRRATEIVERGAIEQRFFAGLHCVSCGPTVFTDAWRHRKGFGRSASQPKAQLHHLPLKTGALIDARVV